MHSIRSTAAIYVGACGALAIAAVPAAAQTRKVGQKPTAGVEATASVGTVVLERYNMVAVQAPRLRDDLKVPLGIQGEIVIPRGAAFRVDQAKPLKACTMAQDTYVDHFAGPRGAACVQDKDDDGAIERVSAELVMFTSKKLRPPVPYDLVDAPASSGSDYFRQTLTLLGAAGGTLRLSYREYSHDMARPAFTEELTYPLGATFPQTITWRETKITLLGLDNAGLRYRVEG